MDKDTDFLQTVLRAELVDFMMYLIEDPNFVILSRIYSTKKKKTQKIENFCLISALLTVFNCFKDVFSAQSVHYFDLLDVGHHTTASTTRNVHHFISLESNLNLKTVFGIKKRETIC